MRPVALAAVVAGVLLAGAALAHVVLAPDPHLSAYRDGPEDLSAFRESLEGLGFGTAAVGASPHVLASLGAPERVVFVVAGVERPYRPGEIDAVVDFVEDGGALVVADDFGFANALADRFDVNYDKLPLVDEYYDVDANLTTVRAAIGEREYAVVLNVPTGLSVRAPDAVVLAVSSEAAFLDANRNGVKDEADVQGATFVAVRVPHGRGTAVFLSDPAVFTNDMLERGDNRAFALDLVGGLLPLEGGTVVFDESRHATNVVAAGAAQAVEALVVGTREGALRWVALASLALVAAAWLRWRRREEALGHHVSRLDEPMPVRGGPERERLQALARARLAAVHGIALDAPPEAWRDASTDEVLGRLAAGDDGLNIPDSLDGLLARLNEYGRRAGPARGPP